LPRPGRRLVEMKDFVDLWFLAMGRARRPRRCASSFQAAGAQAKLQPHMRRSRRRSRTFRLPPRAQGHRRAGAPIEIEYRR
jgi:hypothetical protein